jgi:hypothetical protein
MGATTSTTPILFSAPPVHGGRSTESPSLRTAASKGCGCSHCRPHATRSTTPQTARSAAQRHQRPLPAGRRWMEAMERIGPGVGVWPQCRSNRATRALESLSIHSSLTPIIKVIDGGFHYHRSVINTKFLELPHNDRKLPSNFYPSRSKSSKSNK